MLINQPRGTLRQTKKIKIRVDFEEENDDWNNKVVLCPDKREIPYFDEIRRCGETDAHIHQERW